MAKINWPDQNTAREQWTADKANEAKLSVNALYDLLDTDSVKVYTGSGYPAESIGKTGDIYLRTADGAYIGIGTNAQGQTYNYINGGGWDNALYVKFPSGWSSFVPFVRYHYVGSTFTQDKI